MTLNNVNSLIDGMMKSLGLEKRAKEFSVIQAWNEVVGKTIAAAAQPESIRDGKLFVTTKSSVWANELTMYKSDILTRLNAKVGERVVKDIILKSGKLPKRPRPRLEREAPISLDEIKITEEEALTLDELARKAGDNAYDDVKRLLTVAFRLNKLRVAWGWEPCARCGALQHNASGLCEICEITAQRSDKHG
jgi:hypothetical protein